MRKLLQLFAPLSFLLMLTVLGPACASGPKAQFFDIDQISKAEGITNKQEFDGRILYREAVQAVAQYHVTLADPDKRAAWVTDWMNRYHGAGLIDTEAGTDKAIKEMLSSLGQRFDFYLDAKASEREKEAMRGNFVGIGVTLGFKNKLNPEDIADVKKGPLLSKANPVEVKDAPIENGPAEAAGVMKGDIFEAVDGRPVDGMTMEELVGSIRGAEGSSVDITFWRDGAKVTLTIVRKQVKLHAVKFVDLGDGISRVILRNFESQDASRDMVEALGMASNGKALILDLRDNPGGHLTTAQDVLEMLLPEGTATELHRREGDAIVVESQAFLRTIKLNSLTDSSGKTNVEARGRRPLLIPDTMPLVILINENSASASEIVAGALSYSRRAVIVGNTSVGKGVGQVVLPLSFNRSVHITSFEFRPAGVKMDWAGVAPDHEVSADENARADNQLDFARDLAARLASAQEDKKSRLDAAEQGHRSEFEKTLQVRHERESGK